SCVSQPSAPPLPLPSFPTRRSSDLFAHLVFLRGNGNIVILAYNGPERDEPTLAKTAAERQAAYGFRYDLGKVLEIVAEAVGCLRSEEHTSELQSLTNLVCRLLLSTK